MNASIIEVAQRRDDLLALIKAAGCGRSVNALVRIARMALRHPWQAGIAIASTFVAAALQLAIPRLLGHAVDLTQRVVSVDAGAAAHAALWNTALILFGVSLLRGLFTMVQNYLGESVGHQSATNCGSPSTKRFSSLALSFTTVCTQETLSPSACSTWKACGCSSPPALFALCS